MVSRRAWQRGVVATATAALVGVATAAPAAHAEPNNNNSRKLRAAVTADGIIKHLTALQRIADENGGTRVAGSAGYDRSVDYAEGVLRAAGFQVKRQPFQYQTFISHGPGLLQRVSPSPAADLPNVLMSYSGSGDVTARASVPAGGATGCTAADFGPANVGTIILISRGGGCSFGEKATNAAAAGAAAAIIYNNTTGSLNGTLGETFTLDFVATGITQALGQQLVAQVPGGLTLRVKGDTFRGTATAENLIAESDSGDPNNVVMAGAHLDSVSAGPGINDNGSGSASLLEIATQMRKVKPKNKVRFALWGAEESGLVGSEHYVANLSAAERKKIALYLNFDMVASPNYVRFVYDGDNSAFPVGTGSAAGPAGSGAIEQLFHDYFASQGLASRETPFSGRSDYGPFIAAGVDIPSGGLFTGGEGIKTADEAAVFGGTADVAYDSCYHQACDTINNINKQALEEMSDAIAHAVITYAFDTSSLRAPVRGKGPGAGDSGGGGLHDHDHEVTE
ncbi:M28 family metallopeptidase [Micromonospora narathiwatensis]|uniref:Aminopeptidase Y n=1 Tax=Micromonospora narathiwatensis TaxID=299146 RepID=A0A1A8ZZK9_9ACTN|nr:M28 family metallopeptidase [Micromonospora narathiwatensis]SBT49325.1 aminopeptidase Y [Micromonospora narathiwatensis]